MDDQIKLRQLTPYTLTDDPRDDWCNLCPSYSPDLSSIKKTIPSFPAKTFVDDYSYIPGLWIFAFLTDYELNSPKIGFVWKKIFGNKPEEKTDTDPHLGMSMMGRYAQTYYIRQMCVLNNFTVGFLNYKSNKQFQALLKRKRNFIKSLTSKSKAEKPGIDYTKDARKVRAYEELSYKQLLNNWNNQRYSIFVHPVCNFSLRM